MSAPDAGELPAHILQATVQVAAYVEGMTKADFLADKRTQQAVILNLVIIGEAATKLTDRHPEAAAAHPGIEWQAMRGMRNRIAHGYYDINLDVVWETVAAALPDLAKRLGEIESWRTTITHRSNPDRTPPHCSG
jgi:uncharacterized protein with HEPN domain